MEWTERRLGNVNSARRGLERKMGSGRSQPMGVEQCLRLRLGSDMGTGLATGGRDWWGGEADTSSGRSTSGRGWCEWGPTWGWDQ